jgi:hypothetical protein
MNALGLAVVSEEWLLKNLDSTHWHISIAEAGPNAVRNWRTAALLSVLALRAMDTCIYACPLRGRIPLMSGTQTLSGSRD